MTIKKFLNNVFNGVLKFDTYAQGSKSESMQPYLVLDTGEKMRLYKEADNPFENESLISFSNKRVQIIGRINDTDGILIIDSIKEI